MINQGQSSASCRILKAIFNPKLVGNLAIVLVVVFWVFGNFLTNYIEKDYNKPWLITFLNNLPFLVYFVFFVRRDPLQCYLDQFNEPSLSVEKKKTAVQLDQQKDSSSMATSHQSTMGSSYWNTAKIALPFSVLYLGSNWLTNAAFAYTAVSAVCILSSTCGFFTLIFGWIAHIEHLSLLRVISATATCLGAIAVFIPDLSMARISFAGNFMALLGAVTYGMYSVYLKRASFGSNLSMMTLFAFCGLYSTILAWPVLSFMHISRYEVFELPRESRVYWLVLLNMLAGSFLPNYFWSVAIQCTTPLIVAVGIAFNIPLTIAIQFFMEGSESEKMIYHLLAGLLVLTGLIVANVAEIFPNADLIWDQSVASDTAIESMNTASNNEDQEPLRSSALD